MSLIDNILEKLDEGAMAESMLKHDIAREKYILKNLTVSSYGDFLTEITLYYRHHVRYVRGKDEVPDKVSRIDLAEAIKVVDQAFPSLGGVQYAFTIAKEGIQGGAKYVIDSMASVLKKDWEEQYIDSILVFYINPLDFQQKVELMKQYLAKFGYLTKKSQTAEELASHWQDVIRYHIQLQRSLKPRF